MGEDEMRKALIGIAGVLFVAVIAYGLYYSQGFFVTSSSPKNNGTASYAQPISINFNKRLDSGMVSSFDISPYTSGKTQVIGKSIIFTPDSSYKLNGDYVVTLKNPMSSDGKRLDAVTIKFKVKYVDYKDLSSSEQKRLQSQTDSVEKSQPITSYLPYETLHFKIDYTLDYITSIGFDPKTFTIDYSPSLSQNQDQPNVDD
jgi:hypothetical protein